MLRYALFLFVVFFTYQVNACILERGAIPSMKRNVSMIEVLADKKKYDGKNLMFKGVVDVDLGSVFIFLNKESYDNFVYKNSFRLSIDSEKASTFDEKDLNSLNGKYVSIHGRYINSKSTKTSGTLVDVDLICEFSTRRKEEKVSTH